LNPFRQGELVLTNFCSCNASDAVFCSAELPGENS
jgi:hypothetical protein